MPRLLRRLAHFLELESVGKIKYRQRRPKTCDKPNKVAQPVDKRPPIVYKQDQTRSFLLDVNPITDEGLYNVPKELPPSLPSQQRVEGRSNGRRGMNEIELNATASPYGKYAQFYRYYTHCCFQCACSVALFEHAFSRELCCPKVNTSSIF